MYFGSQEIRALYRDLFFLPLIQEIRKTNNNTRDQNLLTQLLDTELLTTRFLGVGNPSESGVHLLYYFRQVNCLSKEHFMDSAQILKRVYNPNGLISRQPRHPEVKRFVFVDDICGSGETAVRYSNDLLQELLDHNKDARFYYFSLFATTEGLNRVRKESLFKENCGAVFELDPTYRCLENNSRYLNISIPEIDPNIVVQVAKIYGEILYPGHGTGYQDSQMLLGFHHNTPDNTLPIMWMDEPNGASRWTPVFKRYPKIQ